MNVYINNIMSFVFSSAKLQKILGKYLKIGILFNSLT